MTEKVKVSIQVPDKFKPLYDLPDGTDTVILIGGRGGMKTHEASKYAAYQSTIKGKRVQIVRDEKTVIRETILNEVLMRFDSANTTGLLNEQYERLESGIKRLATDQRGEEMVVFTKGMRASSNEKRSNLKGDSNVDIAIMEEAEDIRDENKFNTFADGVRKKGSFILIILNTPDINHWIIRRYFDLVPVDRRRHPNLTAKELEGYFDIRPKQIPGFVAIRSTYSDNPHLPDKTIRRYEGYGDKEAAHYDLHHYLTAIMGYTSTGRKGQYLKITGLISVEEFNEIEAKEVFGQDFGTTSPAGLVRVKMLKNKIYVDELNYIGLDIKGLALMYARLGINENSTIIADSAEPTTIGRLRRGVPELMTEKELSDYPVLNKGFSGIHPVHDKSILAGITLLQSYELYVTSRSVNLQMEIANYVEDTDRNGIGTGVPIDDYNHLIDSLRYVSVSKGRLF